MSILSNLFGGGDSDSSSENANSNDFVSDLDSALSLDASSVQYNHSVDDDGSESTDYSAQQIGTDFSLDNVLANLTDNFSSHDSSSDSDGGLFA